MTFSIVARCARTGMFGVANTSSSIAIGARCPHVRAGVGAVSTQNVTDPLLGPAVLDAMAGGLGAEEAVAHVISSHRYSEYRQVLAIDRSGNLACHSGELSLGIFAEQAGTDCLSAGNMLKSPDVIEAIVSSCEAHPERHLADRLLHALLAGLAAGGEAGPLHSAALKIADSDAFPLVDLRIDWAEEGPLGQLSALWENYRPQMAAYRVRAVDPAAAPSYGVPGDL